MTDNNRTIIVKFRVTEAENQLLEHKFKQSEFSSKSQFIRTMILEGVVVKFDGKKIQNTMRNIAGIAANINQIAVRVNSTGSIYADDVTEIQKDMNELWQQLRSFQSELQKLKQ